MRERCTKAWLKEHSSRDHGTVGWEIFIWNKFLLYSFDKQPKRNLISNEKFPHTSKYFK